ncbi:MAG: TolC family protein, partial [Pseudomonadota bacterium]
MFTRARPVFLLASLATAFIVTTFSHAQTPVTVAVVTDGPLYQLQDVEATFRDELLSLTAGEFDVEFKPLVAEWSATSVEQVMQQAYADPTVDMVMVVGIAANQIVVSRANFPKPTFLPFVFNPDIVGAPSDNGRSGTANLNYLADQIPIDQDFAAFRRVAPFNRVALISDQVIINSLPQGPATIQRAAPDVRFSVVGHDGVRHDLINLLPDDTDAVMLGGLPRLPAPLFDQFLNDLADAGIPSFSLVSEAEVRRGALAAYTTLTDFTRLARRNALNMQAVMLGERAQDQPIAFEGKRQLTINLKTARRIGLSPRFDVLSEAEVIEDDIETVGPVLTLERVARLALENNLGLAASELDVALGAQDVKSAKANLLPQLSIGASRTARRDSALIRGAGSAERSSSGALTLNQIVWSDAALSGYQQQSLLQQGRIARFSAQRLDQILDATTAYLQALRADNQLRIQQDNLRLSKANLDLAVDRVRIGSASNADVFRWQANLAAARSSVLAAQASSQQAREALNRALNQPISQPLQLDVPTPGAPFSLTPAEFETLIDNPKRFGWYIDFSIEKGLERAPELAVSVAEYSSAVGETKIIDLSDGTRVTLGAASAMT